MKGFDARFIEELKNKNDIVDVVGKYVQLVQRGGNYWGKCPFHHEKTASFSVNAHGNFYYCFGCHKSGDVINFIMEMESLDFGDAVKFLAERAKIPLPEIRYDDEKIREQKQKKERAFAVLLETARFYASNLKKDGADKYLEYIIKRKITSEWVAKFGLGASLDFDGLPNHLKNKGFTYQEMVDAGVVSISKSGRYFDALAERLIFPIINHFGQVVAFGGRKLEKVDFGKYKNTGETIIFSKSYNLYNINNLKKLKNEKGIDGVIMVEGYMDTVSLVQAGILNVVASMGTALTKEQARILKRYTDKVFISYDGDSAGQAATLRGLDILSDEGLDVRVISLPDGMDPDDVVKNYGADGYRKLVFEAKPLIDFKLDVVKNSCELNTVDGKRKYVQRSVAVIRESSSPAEQEDLLKTVSAVSGITFEALKRELYSKEVEKEQKVQPVPQFTDNAGDKIALASRFVLSAYLFNKPYAKETDVSKLEFSLPVHKEIQKYILDRITLQKQVVFSDLYEVLSEEFKDEISRIAGMETEENKNFDQATYFFDCVRALKLDKLSREEKRLTALFAAETDNEKRKIFMQEFNKILAEKNKLN